MSIPAPPIARPDRAARVAHPVDSPFAQLAPTAANHEPLSPLNWLARSAAVYPEQPAVIHGAHTHSWSAHAGRCRQMASALLGSGVRAGDVVSCLLANTPPLAEAHFGVPLAGAVLNAINTRLDAATIGWILGHAQSRVLIFDAAWRERVRAALAALDGPAPILVEYRDPTVPAAQALDGAALDGAALDGAHDYTAWLAGGDADFAGYLPAQEWQAISLNYTSGTTGRPKGVVYSHRGAHQLAMGNAIEWALGHHPRYLWTLPMFHCNGWCFPWTLAAVAGTHVCLREVRSEAIFDAFERHAVSHLCGAPIVLDLLARAVAEGARVPRTIKVMTAAAPPPAATLAAVEAAGFDVTHVYGLTEIYGPAVVCAWHQSWNALDPADRAARKSRQGVSYTVQAGLMVADPQSGEAVAPDGQTLGEVCSRGNATMMGYLKDPAATEAAFAGGWFRTGDLGVIHPDGYLQLKDRRKDIIISGGENISSIEIEDALRLHPAVVLAAVVAQPDERWGEVPCAFVELAPVSSPNSSLSSAVDEAELDAHCREHLAGFKRPKRYVFGEIPKTSTGKVQKFLLRERARAPSPDTAP